MKQSLSSKWLKAAVIGSIWAAIEIVVGSFLHNLRVPFAGTFLAATSVFLLVAIMQHWKDSGIIIRAGIICALMKSISPSAIILGPMTGIMFEAFILELSRLIFGRTLLAYIIGGSIAVLWSLLQKIITWLLLYGFDLVRVADTLYDFLVIKTGITSVEPMYFILAVSSIYVILGTLAAIGGYFGGKRQSRLKHKSIDLSDAEFGSKKFFKIDSKQHFYIPVLFLILTTAVIILYLLNIRYYYVAIPLGFVFTGLVIFRYKQSVRHLKKPGIWIQFAVITLFAALLWEWVSTGEYFSRKGLIIGLEMDFRAVIVIFGFAGISTELRNPVLKNLLFNFGLSRLYQSMSIAFSALPVVVYSMPQVKNLFKQRRKLLQELFIQADSLLEFFKENTRINNNIFVITGDVHEGKTRYVKKLAQELIDNGIKVQGFLCYGTFKNNIRSSFSLFDLETEETRMLAAAEEIPGWIPFRRFYFNPETLKKGNAILKNSVNNTPGILIVDEVGPMELEKKGWFPGINDTLKDKNIVHLWVIRKNTLNQALLTWNINRKNCFNIETAEKSMIFERLRNRVLVL
ncbi:MAG: nucleoside-triphosphatase [Bacteroidota bacterium]|nr:nucleoside-triphosphatase [Bacteroidota bacterium]